MACTRKCENCGDWIEWQDTAHPFTIQGHVRLWIVPRTFDTDDRPGGWFCSPECAKVFIEEHAGATDWGEESKIGLGEDAPEKGYDGT